MRLDRIDFEIVTALQKNARLSNKELAAKARVAPSTCLLRMRKLAADGVLRGFRADVDLGSAGDRPAGVHRRPPAETFPGPGRGLPCPCPILTRGDPPLPHGRRERLPDPRRRPRQRPPPPPHPDGLHPPGRRSRTSRPRSSSSTSQPTSCRSTPSPRSERGGREHIPTAL